MCNWIGLTDTELFHAEGVTTPTAAPLGPSVYSGTAGIALFLAQLGTSAGNGDFYRAALGAIASSVRQFDRLVAEPRSSAPSFFAGKLGAAFVAHRIGTLSGHQEWRALSERIIARLIASVARPQLPDLISESAGAIPVLLAMARTPGGDACRELAISLGEELCRFDHNLARATRDGWEQPRPDELSGVPYIRLSNGASAIGLGLLELYAATGRLEFREAGRRSFEYERSPIDDALNQRGGLTGRIRTDSSRSLLAQWWPWNRTLARTRRDA